MKLAYAVAVEIGDAETAHGVVVPDLPGVFSAGDSIDEALANVTQAIALRLEEFALSNLPVPAPTPIEALVGTVDCVGQDLAFPTGQWRWFTVVVETRAGEADN